MSCVSILALGSAGAAAHGGGCLEVSAPTTINSNKKCVKVEETTVSGDVVNNATIGKGNAGNGVGDGNAERKDPGFFIGDEGLIDGKLVNNGTIVGGSEGFGALTLGEGADVTGGIFNNGTIASKRGSGISLGMIEYDDDEVEIEAAKLTGDIVNAGLISGNDFGIVARYGTMTGSLINQSTGVISGGLAGIYIADTFTSWTGGIHNSGAISGGYGGILIGDWGLPTGGYGGEGGEGGEDGGEAGSYSLLPQGSGVVFSGGILNNTGGSIVSGYGPSIGIGGASFAGGVYNDGLITQGLGEGEGYGLLSSPYSGVGIVFAADTVEGGLTNDVNGQIFGLEGPAVWITDQTSSFSGGIGNAGLISGASDGIRIESATFGGGLFNGETGQIVGSTGEGVFATSAWSGGVQNDGLITGGRNGFTYDGTTFSGGFANNGTIGGGANAVALAGESFDGGFANTGLLEGGTNGVVMSFGNIAGGFTNSGTVTGTYGNGVSITATDWGAADARANIHNTSSGVISGGATGFYLSATNVYGDFLNDGSLSGDGEDTGVHLVAELFDGNVTNNGTISSAYNALRLDFGTFDGSFSNTATISGGSMGAILALGSMTGDFTNSGSITGTYGNGVSITATDWGAADARANIHNTSSGVISGGTTGFYLSATNVYGDFLNDGSISGDGEDTGVHLVAELFDGNVTNNGTISSAHNALRLDFGTFDGSFANTATIAGGSNGAIFALGSMTGDFTNSGTISGEIGDGVSIGVGTWGSEEDVAAILNTIDGEISGGEDGFQFTADTLYATVTNDGVISGGANGAVIAVTNFNASVANNGTISGGTNGLVMVLADASGGFTNSGEITGESGTGVSITAANWGSVAARADIVNTASGVITGGGTGFYLNVTNVYGDFVNDGSISGDGEDSGAHLVAELFAGDVTNNGTISSAYDALRLDFGTFDGSFANTATIAGGSNGAILALGSMTGDFTNSGSITGTYGNGVSITATADVRANIHNTSSGLVSGGATGFYLNATNVYGDFTNSGTISGESGNGVSIGVGTWGSEEDVAAILNTIDGEISGGEDGFQFTADTLYATVTNDGVVSGGVNGAVIAVTNLNASVANNGTISGGTNGLVMVLADASGGFTNSGEITGESGTGVSITAANWGSAAARADIVNTASGTITGGETGFYMSAGAVYGDFKNEGTIIGGGSETGVHLIADLFDGDVINDGLAQAASNALHLEFGTLTGVVRNTDTIEATSLPGTAVLLAIGNGATFENAGLVLGDVQFAGAAAYAFVGESGGVEGSLIGEGFEGNDDTIAVRGEHYFVGGTASNFASFTVEDGGAALMGARSEGGSSAGGYSFANVDQLTVESGGLLYIDRSAVLEVGTYDQEAGSIVEFFLGAPEGLADLTGDVTAGEGDYGRIIVRGVATLNGTVAGLLDPLFETANADLTSVVYEDVIVADGGINGDFSAVALIANSSLFEMNSTRDGNTIDVTVARTSLGDISDVPGVIVSLGGPFDAMVSDRSNGVGSSSCGLASAAGGGCFNRFAQNDATQTMTDASPEDPFDWLRTGVREVGETAVWGRGIGAWGESDGWAGSKGSKFDLAGAIVGVDYVFDTDLMAGLAAQWTTTDVDFKGRPDNAEVENFEFGAYASLGDTRLYLNANASAIWHDVTVKRFSNGGGRATGNYGGTTLSAFAEGGKIFETDEGMRIGPFLSLSLTHLATDAYRERGTGPLLHVRDATLDSLKSTAGVRLGYPIELKSGRKVVPELRLGWTHEFMDTQAAFRASVIGQNQAPSVILGEKFARDTVQLGTGVTVPVSDATNLYVDYDAGLNPDITTHTVSVGLRTRW